MPPRYPTPFAALDMTFRLVVASAPRLSVNGRRIGHGLPRRRIRLDELRALLTLPTVHPAARSTALRHLARRARTGEPMATVALAGVLLPILRQVADRLAATHPGAHPADIEAAVLTAFKHLLTCQHHAHMGARRRAVGRTRPATTRRSSVWYASIRSVRSHIAAT